MKPFLSAIIPAYNESERLPLTLVEMNQQLSQAGYSYEILVVSDGSTDDTAEVVNRFNPVVKYLRLVENKGKNHGKGWAVKTGMLEASGNYRLFTDADNSTSIDQFDNMLPFFKEGYQVVIGSRAIEGVRLEPPEPLYKQVLGKGGNLIIQLLAVPGIWDTQCGFKCFTEEAATRIFSAVRIDRWGFDVEALALARLFGFRVKEIPVRWVNDIRSKVGWRDYFSTLLDVLRIRIRLSRGKYDLQ